MVPSASLRRSLPRALAMRINPIRSFARRHPVRYSVIAYVVVGALYIVLRGILGGRLAAMLALDTVLFAGLLLLVVGPALVLAPRLERTLSRRFRVGAPFLALFGFLAISLPAGFALATWVLKHFPVVP